MTDKTLDPCGSDSSTELGLLPIGPHDHPEPRTMMWSALELAAIKEYAARCVAAEREQSAALRTVAEQVLCDMQAQGLLIEWQTMLEEVLQPNTGVDRASGSGRTQS